MIYDLDYVKNVFKSATRITQHDVSDIPELYHHYLFVVRYPEKVKVYDSDDLLLVASLSPDHDNFNSPDSDLLGLAEVLYRIQYIRDVHDPI